MEAVISKARVLVEALPYIKAFYGKTVVVKYGGAAMTDPQLKQQVLQDLVLMRFVGMRPVVVHGGGPEITSAMERLGKPVKFVHGRRVTDAEAMELIERVLVKEINAGIVAAMVALGAKAQGLSGKDGGLLLARKLMPDGLDLGFVGEVVEVRTEPLLALEREQTIPVIAPVGRDAQGQTYNINADDVAAAIASSLKADKLVLLTDVPGILQDPKDPATLLSTLKVQEIDRLIAAQVISGGMLPKVRACESALAAGVAKTHIVDGRVPHALLLEIYTDQGIGTEILRGE